MEVGRGPEGRNSSRRHTAAMDILILGALWGASVLVVNPAGNFPLNDDWSYGLAVKRLLAEHAFHPTGWTAMPLLTNVLWGALFCVPKGFSFTALRISTLCLGFGGVASTYLLLRKLAQPRELALLAGLALGLNPLYFALSHTFMTDVPFTAMTLLSVLFLARDLLSPSAPSLAAGTILAVAACLSRQLGIAIPLGFAVTLFLTRRFDWRSLARAFLPFTACAIALFEFHRRMSAAGRLPALYDAQTHRLLHGLAHPLALVPMMAFQSRASLLYLGLFLFPILIFPAAQVLRSRRGLAIFGGVLLVLCFLGGMSALRGHGVMMPILENVLIASGIGPVTLGSGTLPAMPRFFWILVTGFSYVGAAILVVLLILNVARIAKTIRANRNLDGNERIGVFLLLSAALYLAPLVATEMLDRYLILLVPLVIGAVIGLNPASAEQAADSPVTLRVCAALFVLAMGIFSVGSVHDYLAWNRARWKALDDLTERVQVTPNGIDGGFEFGELHAYAAADYLNQTDIPNDPEREVYKLSFETEAGYKAVKAYPFTGWLPPRRGTVFILQKQP